MVFAALQSSLESDQMLRERIRQEVKLLEQTSRLIQSILGRIHQPSQQTDSSNLQRMLKEVRELFREQLQPQLIRLADLVPRGQYYRYQELWYRTLQQVCFQSALWIYLAEGRLMQPEDVPIWLGLPLNQSDVAHVPIEDFLHGLVSLSGELSRWAVTSVIAGEWDRPVSIAAFLEDLFRGFQLLNLRNDLLRKRFDGMKYDLKKVEEVVYNLKLRKLTGATTRNLVPSDIELSGEGTTSTRMS